MHRWCRSGLRGAVGLSLSLFVLLDRQISDLRFRSLAVFFMGAQALLTLVIQGTTMPWLLQVCLPHRPCQTVALATIGHSNAMAALAAL